jgi:hypothetical protein
MLYLSAVWIYACILLILADPVDIAKEFCAIGRNLPVNRAGHAQFAQNDKKGD